ncbi:hypothetical protein [Methylacidimicrobium tartarophylax]|uniref:Uncharacterized protein n=1 Tax=Methylacidimicrobium tartarophylax TaxID=1041768 RepID=A0A5E6M6R5_9BACT|nr:hypothetical protein [Methylacidimicrobium tartarophylax]VVM05047.1 hypothetical protein MAMT_00433 [Methylacidimicrobium tartarophylax]
MRSQGLWTFWLLLWVTFLLAPEGSLKSYGQVSIAPPAEGADASQSPSPESDSSGGAGLVNTAVMPDGASTPAPTAPTDAAAPAAADSGGAASGAAQDGSTAPPAGNGCCPPLPNSVFPAAAAQLSTAQAAEGTAAAGAAVGANMGAAAAAAAAATALQSSRRGPGLTPVPASRQFPPSQPNPITVADQRNWAAIDKAGVQIITIGEHHFDPAMMDAEAKFLQSAYAHGFRNLILEYPTAKQKELDAFLKNPSYQNMAEVDLGFGPDSPTQQQHSKDVKIMAAAFQTIDSQTPRMLKATAIASGNSPALVDALQGRMQMFYLWRHAHNTGYQVIAGDLDRNAGLDQNGNLIVNSPSRQITPKESMDFLKSPDGMRERNESIAAIAANVTRPNARTISIGGAYHTGFRPNERMSTTSKPNATYPGLNYIWENIYHIPSVAIVQSGISRQGYLAELGSGYFSKPVKLAQFNQQAAANIALDPSRAPYDPLSGKPIHHSLSDAVNRRQSSVPQGP